MESKVISVRVDLDFLEQINDVANRLYAKSYTGQPNRSQLLLDALKVFCDLAEMGKFDHVNLAKVSGDVVLDSAVNTVNNNQELTEAIKKELLPEIESLIIKHQNHSLSTEYIKIGESVDTVNKSVDSVDRNATMTLRDAHKIAQSRGYKYDPKAFSTLFSQNRKTKDFNSYGIKRIHQGKRKPGLYIDIFKDRKSD